MFYLDLPWLTVTYPLTCDSLIPRLQMTQLDFIFKKGKNILWKKHFTLLLFPKENSRSKRRWSSGMKPQDQLNHQAEASWLSNSSLAVSPPVLTESGDGNGLKSCM